MKFNDAKRARILEALRTGHHRSSATRSAGLTYETLRARMRADPEFAREVENAEEDAHEAVEDALLRKAVAGDLVAIQVWLYNRSPDRWKDRRRAGQVGPEAVLACLPPAFASQVRAALGGVAG